MSGPLRLKPYPLALTPGLRVTSRDGSVYVTAGKQGSTLQRATPKIRGKAARKADKNARRLARDGGKR